MEERSTKPQYVRLLSNIISINFPIICLLGNYTELPDGLYAYEIRIDKIGEFREEYVTTVYSNIQIVLGKLRLAVRLPTNIEEGVYIVSYLKVHKQEAGIEWIPTSYCSSIEQLPSFLVTKVLSHDGKSGYNIARMLNYRKSRITSAIYTSEYLKQKLFSLGAPLIFICSPGIVHQMEFGEGLTLVQCGSGVGYGSIFEITSSFVKDYYATNLDHNQDKDFKFRRENPVFAIVFHNVHAANMDDARRHLSNRVDRIRTTMALHSKVRPEILACLYRNPDMSWDSNYFTGFYSGNLIDSIEGADFIGKSIAVSRLMDARPLFRLLLDKYMSALNEKDRDLKFLKMWTVLEQVAKIKYGSSHLAIRDEEGGEILDKGKRPVTTQYAKGKVYQLLYDSDIPISIVGTSLSEYVNYGNPHNIVFLGRKPYRSQAAIIVTLWDQVSMLYEIRNQVAHTGTFDMGENENISILNSRFAKIGADLIHNLLRNICEASEKIVLDQVS